MADEITPQMLARYRRALRADQRHVETQTALWWALTTRASGRRLPADLREAPDPYSDRLVREMKRAEAADAAQLLQAEMDAMTKTLPYRRWSNDEGEGVELSADPADGLKRQRPKVMKEATRQRLDGRPVFGKLRRYRTPNTPG